jgi:hypothetical protein
MDGYVSRGISWTAKTLTDRGKRSQESRYGADFMIVLTVNLPRYRIAKGFLAQAKLVHNGRIGNLQQLKQQCEMMLNLSAHSFVFLYSTEYVRVLPAIAVLGADDPMSLYFRSAQRFFEEHLQCFVGDRSISSATPKQLDNLQRQYEARRALLLGAEAAR